MGIFGRMKDPVDGVAQVVSATQLTEQAVRASCRIRVVLQAPGLEAVAAEDTVMAPTQKWPIAGSQLPVRIDRANPQKFRVLWDQVESASDQAQRQAQAMADAANQKGGAFGPASIVPPQAQAVVEHVQGLFPGATVDASSMVATGDAASQAVHAVEQAMGQDIDGDGIIGPPPGSGSEPAAAATPARGGDQGDDRLANLERLAKLRESGVLTDEEFAAEKRRILDS